MQQNQQSETTAINLTAGDCDNLVNLLNRVQTTGLQEANLLLGYARLINDAKQRLGVKPDEQAGETNGEE